MPDTPSQIDVLGQKVTLIEYRGHRVVTLKQIDELHRRPEGTARRQFNANKTRFIAGRDQFEVSANEIRSQIGPDVIGAKRGGTVLLFTERGYGKIVKGWNDDLAWQLHDAMQDAYFLVQDVIAEIAQELPGENISRLHDAVARHGNEIAKHFDDSKFAMLKYIKVQIKERLLDIFDYLEKFRGAVHESNKLINRNVTLIHRDLRVLADKLEPKLSDVGMRRAEWCDIHDIYFAIHCVSADIVPRRGSLSSSLMKSLDSYCLRHKLNHLMAEWEANGRHTRYWHIDAVRPWYEAIGGKLIEDHFVRNSPRGDVA